MNFTKKEFIFSDPSDFQETKVLISEIIDAAYGLYVWPCAPVLAQHVWLNRLSLAQKSVLEIGAGTALPGIVAARCKADVILSDNSQFKNCLDLCKRNAELNSLPEVTVLGLTWGLVTPTMMSLPKVDVILASDCFYDSKDFEDVVMTLSYLLQWNPQAEVWCAYQVRSPCLDTVDEPVDDSSLPPDTPAHTNDQTRHQYTGVPNHQSVVRSRTAHQMLKDGYVERPSFGAAAPKLTFAISHWRLRLISQFWLSILKG